MEKVEYTKAQIDSVLGNLDKISVSGVNSVTLLAMVFQELNNGQVVKEIEEVKDNG